MSGDSWLKGNIVTPSVSSEQDVCFVFSLSSAGVLSRITSIQIFRCRLLSTFVATRLSEEGTRACSNHHPLEPKVGNIPPDILGDSESTSTTVLLLHKEMHDTQNTSKNIFVIRIIYSHLYDCCFITWHTVNNCPNTNKNKNKKINWVIQFCTETAKHTNNKKMKYSIMSADLGWVCFVWGWCDAYSQETSQSLCHCRMEHFCHANVIRWLDKYHFSSAKRCLSFPPPS